MIKEFAFSLSKRHYFQDSSDINNWYNLDNDTFMSLYDYDDYVKDFFTKNNTIAGFDGMIYIPDEFILDVDGNGFDNALKKAIGLKILLADLDVPYKLFFSGTGFHFHLPSDAFRWRPSKNLHLKVKDALKEKGIFEYADPAVTDKTRLIRVPNTKNRKSNLYKVEIAPLTLERPDVWEYISKYAKSPQNLSVSALECNPVFDVLERIPQSEKTFVPEFISQGRNPDPVNYPCISGMIQSNPIGRRHSVALRLAAWFRWLYPEGTVRLIMEEWRKQVDNGNKPFKPEEVNSIINNCYDGHGGKGYRYGCMDPIMDEYCKNTCRLYKSKKDQTVMDSLAMETHLMDFLRSDSKPINLGDLYPGQDFPIYPGEVVILQAPPKSMKTMLLQNWMNAFKKPTYFIEMEMSPRQIWSRFVQIEMGWDEEELKGHYQQMSNGMDKRFKWLTVDYSTPYAHELEKRISMLAVKPEIVVVDHMGLFKSKQRDANMKVEEASQALMELAVRHNIIVFTVSEITKQAFHEGMNMASSKGSFRTAYNTNKLLSVNPAKSVTTGLIERINIKCEANREREMINVNLKVKNTRIVYEENTF